MKGLSEVLRNGMCSQKKQQRYGKVFQKYWGMVNKWTRDLVMLQKAVLRTDGKCSEG